MAFQSNGHLQRSRRPKTTERPRELSGLSRGRLPFNEAAVRRRRRVRERWNEIALAVVPSTKPPSEDDGERLLERQGGGDSRPSTKPPSEDDGESAPTSRSRPRARSLQRSRRPKTTESRSNRSPLAQRAAALQRSRRPKTTERTRQAHHQARLSPPSTKPPSEDDGEAAQVCPHSPAVAPLQRSRRPKTTERTGPGRAPRSSGRSFNEAAVRRRRRAGTSRQRKAPRSPFNEAAVRRRRRALDDAASWQARAAFNEAAVRRRRRAGGRQRVPACVGPFNEAAVRRRRRVPPSIGTGVHFWILQRSRRPKTTERRMELLLLHPVTLVLQRSRRPKTTERVAACAAAVDA